MQEFEYCIPTKVVFGEGVVNKVGENVKKLGNKVMLVTYDKAVVESIGVYQKVRDSLNVAGVEVVEFFGVKPNPDLKHIREGIVMAKENNVDVILAVGGGSALDEGKAIVVGAKLDEDIWDIFQGEIEITTALPLVTVLTIPATSSEMNNVSVITNNETKKKLGFGSPFFYPTISVMDPELTYGIPHRFTAMSSADAISHLLEGYLTHEDEWVPMHTGNFVSLIKTIMESTERIMKDPKDKQARATIMWATTWAWNGFGVTGLGAFGADMHMVAHSLGGFYDMPHGETLSVVMPGFMKYMMKKGLKKNLVHFAENVFGVKTVNDELTAKAGIMIFQEWLDSIGTPTSFAAANIPTNELEALADDALDTAKAWGIEGYSKENILEIYGLCL